MTKKTYESPSLLPGACKSGRAAHATRQWCSHTPIDPWHLARGIARSHARDLGLNKDETGAHILATFEAVMNSAVDTVTVAVTH